MTVSQYDHVVSRVFGRLTPLLFLKLETWNLIQEGLLLGDSTLMVGFMEFWIFVFLTNFSNFALMNMQACNNNDSDLS